MFAFMKTCLIFVSLRLKEYMTTYSMGRELCKDILKTQHPDNEAKLFTVRYLMAASKSYEKDPSEALNTYYALLKQVDGKLKQEPAEPSQINHTRARDAMAIEVVEMFGLMPAADNYVAKYIMLSSELIRVHLYTRKDEAKAERPEVFL